MITLFETYNSKELPKKGEFFLIDFINQYDEHNIRLIDITSDSHWVDAKGSTGYYYSYIDNTKSVTSQIVNSSQMYEIYYNFVTKKLWHKDLAPIEILWRGIDENVALNKFKKLKDDQENEFSTYKKLYPVDTYIVMIKNKYGISNHIQGKVTGYGGYGNENKMQIKLWHSGINDFVYIWSTPNNIDRKMVQSEVKIFKDKENEDSDKFNSKKALLNEFLLFKKGWKRDDEYCLMKITKQFKPSVKRIELTAYQYDSNNINIGGKNEGETVLYYNYDEDYFYHPNHQNPNNMKYEIIWRGFDEDDAKEMFDTLKNNPYNL